MERFEREIGVAKLSHAAARFVEPGRRSPHPDQILMKPVGRPAERRQIRWRRGKRGTDRIVAAGTALLDPPEGLYVAGIDRRRTAASHQGDQRVGKMPLIQKLTRDTRDI